MPTSQRTIETPVGSKVGVIWEKLEILGISSYLTQTQNQPNDENLQWTEYVDISVPVGTLAVVPSINVWVLAHGRLDPDLIDPLDENQKLTWNSADRPWGLGHVHVGVMDVDAPDMSASPPQQTARLQIDMHLCDYNMDDGWFGIVGYTLVFLGRHPETVRPGAAAEALMSRAVAISFGRKPTAERTRPRKRT